MQVVASRRFVPLSNAFYRVAAIGLIIFAATSLDTFIGGPPHVEVTSQNFTSGQELINFASAFTADLIVFVLLPLPWLPMVWCYSRTFSWQNFLSIRAI